MAIGWGTKRMVVAGHEFLYLVSFVAMRAAFSQEMRSSGGGGGGGGDPRRDIIGVRCRG